MCVAGARAGGLIFAASLSLSRVSSSAGLVCVCVCARNSVAACVCVSLSGALCVSEEERANEARCCCSFVRMCRVYVSRGGERPEQLLLLLLLLPFQTLVLGRTDGRTPPLHRGRGRSLRFVAVVVVYTADRSSLSRQPATSTTLLYTLLFLCYTHTQHSCLLLPSFLRFVRPEVCVAVVEEREAPLEAAAPAVSVVVVGLTLGSGGRRSKATNNQVPPPAIRSAELLLLADFGGGGGGGGRLETEGEATTIEAAFVVASTEVSLSP